MNKLTINILGADCNKCNTFFARVQEIVNEYHLDAVVEETTDTQTIIGYGIYTPPAILINNKVVSKGCLLTKNEIIEKINQFLTLEEQIPIVKTPIKKKIIYFLFLGIIIAAIFLLLYFSNSKPTATSSKITNQTATTKLTLADCIRLMYDYSKQNTTYQLTYIEFGSVGCRECKKMEEVMKEVKKNFSGKINVVFYNIREDINKTITDFYKIQMIPVQVLLDKNGNEVFRNIGFYSYKDLCIEFKKLGIN